MLIRLVCRTGVFSFFLLCTTVTASPQNPDGDLSNRLEVQQAELARIEQELAATNAEMRMAKARERALASQVVAASNRAGLTKHAINRLTEAETALVSDMNTAQIRTQQTREEIERRRESISLRVRTLYIHGRREPFQRALMASSLAHWLAAREYLTAAARRDANEIRSLKRDQVRLDSLTALYSRQKMLLDTLITTRERQREELAGAEMEARRLLRAMRAKRRTLEQSAEALESQRAESRQRIAEFLSSQTGASPTRMPLLEQGPGLREETGFVNLKGQLPWPVEGRVTSRFGRRRDAATQTWTRSRGIDIRVPKGTEVTAVGAGKIVMVDWFRGYGSFVIVSHGQNYYTLYAHLDEIHVQKNEHVQQGQVIGLSGDSGTLGEEKLHFELLGGPQALNPLDWLQPRRTGL